MADSQLAQYIPVLMLGVLAVVFSFGMLVMSVVLGKRGKRTPVKDTPYECGMVPVGPGTTRLSVRFYLVAILFILFDIEVVFLYPWAVVFHQLRAFGLVEILVFAAVVFVSFMYLVSHGALDWAPAKRLRPAIGARTTESTVTRVGSRPKSQIHEAA